MGFLKVLVILIIINIILYGTMCNGNDNDPF